MDAPTTTTSGGDGLAARLDQLAQDLLATAPTGADGAPAQLSGLLPCEPVIGDVAVVCWVAGDGGEQFDLVRLADGVAVDDHTAMREALTLLAITETLEELAAFGELGAVADELAAWRAAEGSGVDGVLDAALDAGAAALTQLAMLAHGNEPRVARTSWLDAVGGALRTLEQAWTRLEAAAEAWSDAQLAADPDSPIAIARVQGLWSALSGARRGPLARPSSSAIHEGREAGAAMAAAIAEARQG